MAQDARAAEPAAECGETVAGTPRQDACAEPECGRAHPEQQCECPGPAERGCPDEGGPGLREAIEAVWRAVCAGEPVCVGPEDATLERLATAITSLQDDC